MQAATYNLADTEQNDQAIGTEAERKARRERDRNNEHRRCTVRQMVLRGESDRAILKVFNHAETRDLIAWEREELPEVNRLFVEKLDRLRLVDRATLDEETWKSIISAVKLSRESTRPAPWPQSYAKAAEWEFHRPTIKQLYRSLGAQTDIPRIMEERQGFNYKIRKYNMMMRYWGDDELVDSGTQSPYNTPAGICSPLPPTALSGSAPRQLDQSSPASTPITPVSPATPNPWNQPAAILQRHDSGLGSSIRTSTSSLLPYKHTNESKKSHRLAFVNVVRGRKQIFRPPFSKDWEHVDENKEYIPDSLHNEQPVQTSASATTQRDKTELPLDHKAHADLASCERMTTGEMVLHEKLFPNISCGLLSVDARNSLGETFLQVAARAGLSLIVKELLLHGADPAATNFNGQSILDSTLEKATKETSVHTTRFWDCYVLVKWALQERGSMA